MRVKTFPYYFLLAVVSVLIASCQNRPKEVLSRKKMEQVMYDVYVAEAIMENDYQSFDLSEKKEAYIDQVFKLNQVTHAQWDTSLSWYSDRIDIYLRMNDSVKARLKREQTSIDSKMAELSIQISETDESVFSASYIPKYHLFSTIDKRNEGLNFSFDSIALKENITADFFSFSYTVMGVTPSAVYDLSSLLTLVYSDTTIYHPQEIKENRTYSTPITKYITGDTLKHIHGFVHLKDPISVKPNIQLYNISMGDK